MGGDFYVANLNITNHTSISRVKFATLFRPYLIALWKIRENQMTRLDINVRICYILVKYYKK